MAQKRYSYYEEEIVVKPSTELIPDEYEHVSNQNINLHIFKAPMIETDCFVKTFEPIGYNVSPEKIHTVNKKEQFEEKLKAIQEQSNNSDALILVFALFYRKKGTIDFNKTDYDIKNIWTMFTTKNCPGLKNKPKIFIFQLTLMRDPILTDGIDHYTVKYELTYDTPSEADMLILYHTSTDEDFLQNLCNNITDYGKSEDLITLTSITEVEPRPIIISTLTRKFFTTVSDQRGHHLVINENTGDLQNILDNINKRLAALEDHAVEKKEKRKFSFREIFHIDKDDKNKSKKNKVRSITEENKKEDKKKEVKIERKKEEDNEVVTNFDEIQEEKKKENKNSFLNQTDTPTRRRISNIDKPALRPRLTSASDDFSRKNPARKTTEGNSKKPAWK